MKRNIMKKISLINILSLLISICLFSCQSSKLNNDFDNNETIDITLTKKCIQLKEKAQKNINLDNVDTQKIADEFNGNIISANWVGEKIVIESYPKDVKGCIELGLFDPYNNIYNKKSNITFTASYRNSILTISDRYYLSLNTYVEENDKLVGKVVLYDMYADEVRILDEYPIYNIVQYITAINEDEFAYFYYDGNTQEWVVKKYNLSSDESKEIFRHTNNTQNVTSPVALSSSSNKIVLVLQTIDSKEYDVELLWIENNSYKTERINLHIFFDGMEYMISNLSIKDSQYYFQVMVNDAYEYFIFNRDENEFNVVLPAVYHFNELCNLDTDIKMLFNGNDSSKHQKSVYNVNNSEFENYLLIKSTSLDDLYTVRCNENSDLFILYKESNMYSYQLVTNFESYARQGNSALFVSPQEQIEYAKEHYPEEKASKIQNECTELLKDICNGDFRWRYIYLNNDNLQIGKPIRKD